MTAITRFEEIDAWKSARELINQVYAISNQSGFNRDFGLRDQVRRAAVSVMSNIAEGFEGRTDVQFINFLEWRRHQLEKAGHNFTLHWIKNIFRRSSLMKRWQLLKSALDKSPNS